MKKAFFIGIAALLLLICLPPAVLADWSTESTVNNPICTAVNHQWYPELISDGLGGAIITWSDNRTGNRDIYAQRVDASGNVMWTSNGIAICTAVDFQVWPMLVSDGWGGAIITWQDYRNGNNDIYAQRVSASGNVLWTDNGVVTCNASDDQFYPELVSDGSGGAVITWHDKRNGIENRDIYAQRVSASGNVLWTDNGVAISTAASNQREPKLVSDGSGGAIIAWQDFRSGNYDIYAQRVSASGSVQWTENGTSICTALWGQWYPELVSDVSSGAIITWQDYRDVTPHIYAQRVNASGSTQWNEDGTAICTADNGQLYPELVSDGSGGAIITWEDYRDDIIYGDIYVQRVNDSGIVQWTDNGTAICTAANDQWYPELVSDGSGGAIITWEDYREDGIYGDIYAQRVNDSGIVQWTDNGTVICTASDDQWYPELVSDGSGGAIITWEDYRHGTNNGDIYAQQVNASGLLGQPAAPEPPTPPEPEQDGWWIRTVEGEGSTVGLYTSLALDSDDYPHISYYDQDSGNLRYASYEGYYWDQSNVDSVGDVGMYTSLALDGSNYPHISYYDDTSKDLKYARFNGTDWDIETVDSSDNVGWYTSLALDGNDNPHISYYDSTNRNLKYASYDGLTWSTDNVDSSGDVGWYTSLALDSNDNPHVSYFDVDNAILKYASYDGLTWSLDNVAFTNDVAFSSLALDGSDHPHISYIDSDNYELKYASFDGDTWSIDNVDSTGDVSWYASLALDSSNYPHITYYDITNKDLKYARFNGTDWDIETVDSDGDVGMYTSLALDSNNYPHISYYDDSGYPSCKYATTSMRSTWSLENIDSVGIFSMFTSLALDGNSYPHISYYDDTSKDLKYARFNGTAWSTETIDSDGTFGWYTSLALDGCNYRHISYYDDTNKDLKYARFNGTDWDIEMVDSSDNVGQYTSLAVDGSNYPHISYYDDTNKDLKYARFNGIDWDIETVDSSDNVGMWTSLALDSSNYPCISYYDETNENLKYARFNGTDWDIETVDSDGDVGVYNSLALDSNDCPHISYIRIGMGWDEVRYAVYNGATWSIKEDLDGSMGSGETSIAVDSNDYPHISYAETWYFGGSLKYASYDGSLWSIETADAGGTDVWAGDSSSLALDGNDSPHISYFEYGSGNLKYAKRSTSPSQIASSTGTGTTSFLWSAGEISKPNAVTEDDLPAEGKPNVTFPHGLYSFKIMELTPGQTVVVTITFPSVVPTGTQYWKYHEPEGWVNVSSLLGDNDGDNVLTLTLTDGGLGDDDGTANGVIVDAGGPGIPVTPPSSSVVGGGGGGGSEYYYLRTNIIGAKYRFLMTYVRNKIVETAKLTSEDGLLTITIPEGTVAKDKNDDALLRLDINANNNPPQPPEDNQIIGLTYDFQPDGAKFDPPITITRYYDSETLPSGIIEEALSLAYYDKDTNSWVTLEDSTVNTEQHSVTASVSHFTDFAIIGAITPPASFTASNIIVQPVEVKPDEIVTVTVTITNTGGMEGTYNLALKINGVDEATKDITLSAGVSESVNFILSKKQPGIYSVDVNGLEDSFNVIEPAPTILPSPTPAPRPRPTPAPVLPPPPPVPAPLPPAPPSTNWWLIGGVILACAVIGLVGWQLVTHRRD